MTHTYIPDLDIDKIVIGKAQVRMSINQEDLQDLASSIRVQGLLEPIVVFETADHPGHYEVIAGQRRFLAVKNILGLPTIRALVTDAPVDDADAKALSLTENLLRTDPNRSDTIDACTDLYYKYGDVKVVAEKTGLPLKRVREYVKTARLVPALQELVKQHGLAPATALRAQDAATDDQGNVNEEEAVVLARELGNMSGAQQKAVVKKRQENPETDIDDLIEDAKSGSRVVQILVTMSGEAHQALKQYAKQEGTTLDDAARGLIEAGLGRSSSEDDE